MGKKCPHVDIEQFMFFRHPTAQSEKKIKFQPEKYRCFIHP